MAAIKLVKQLRQARTKAAALDKERPMVNSAVAKAYLTANLPDGQKLPLFQADFRADAEKWGDELDFVGEGIFAVFRRF